MDKQKSLVGKKVAARDFVNDNDFPYGWRTNASADKPIEFEVLAQDPEDDTIFLELNEANGGFVDPTAKERDGVNKPGVWVSRNFKEPNKEFEDADRKTHDRFEHDRRIQQAEEQARQEQEQERLKTKPEEPVAIENKTSESEKGNGMNENLMAGGVRVVSRKLVKAFQNLLIKGLKMATAKKYGWTEKDMGLKKNAKKIQEMHDFAEMFLSSDLGKVVLNLFAAEMIKFGRDKLGNILPEKAGFGADMIAQEMTTEATSLGMEKILDEGLKLFAPGVAAMLSDPETAKLAAAGVDALNGSMSSSDPEQQAAVERIMNVVGVPKTA